MGFSLFFLKGKGRIGCEPVFVSDNVFCITKGSRSPNRITLRSYGVRQNDSRPYRRKIPPVYFHNEGQSLHGPNVLKSSAIIEIGMYIINVSFVRICAEVVCAIQHLKIAELSTIHAHCSRITGRRMVAAYSSWLYGA